MFSDVNQNSTQRIVEIREFLDFFSSQIPKPPITTPRYFNTSKGLIFVQLYGVIEYTINSTVARSIFLLNSESVKILDVKPPIWGMVLNPELDSLNQANRKKWSKRLELFQKIALNENVSIATDVMPTNGDNFHVPQLQSIWDTFQIRAPLFHDVKFRGRLQDIVANRINIAHGNSSAADIGSAVTVIDLQERVTDVSKYCSYFISVFEDYINNRGFSK